MALARWSIPVLQGSKDPLAEVILAFMRSGAEAALYLRFVKVGNALQAVAHGALGPESRVGLWDGLGWAPQTHGAAWAELTQKGFVRCPPPGETSAQPAMASEAVRALRAALATQPGEHVALVRIGTNENCRGLLAVVSKKEPSAEIIQRLIFVGAQHAAPRRAA